MMRCRVCLHKGPDPRKAEVIGISVMVGVCRSTRSSTILVIRWQEWQAARLFAVVNSGRIG